MKRGNTGPTAAQNDAVVGFNTPTKDGSFSNLAEYDRLSSLSDKAKFIQQFFSTIEPAKLDQEKKSLDTQLRVLDDNIGKSKTAIENNARQLQALEENYRMMEREVQNWDRDNKVDQKTLDECFERYSQAQSKLLTRNSVKTEIASKMDYKEINNTKFASATSVGNLPFQWAEQTLYATQKWDWKAFKKTRLGKNGEEFRMKLKDWGGDQIVINQELTKKVLDNKSSIFTEVEKKGQNKSLRAMVDYIEFMSSLEQAQQLMKNEKMVMDEAKKRVEGRESQILDGTNKMSELSMNSQNVARIQEQENQNCIGMQRGQTEISQKLKILGDFENALKEKGVSSPQSYLRAMSKDEESNASPNKGSPAKTNSQTPIQFDKEEPVKTKGNCEGCSIF
jgi:hypothetical protein